MNVDYIGPSLDRQLDRPLNRARKKMIDTFHTTLTTYTLEIAKIKRTFWVDNNVFDLKDHKNPCEKIWEKMKEYEISRQVGEFFKTACKFERYTRQSHDAYSYPQECFETLQCFVKFLSNDTEYTNFDACFRQVYQKNSDFKVQCDEAVRCMVAFLQKILDATDTDWQRPYSQSTLALFKQHDWPQILQKLQNATPSPTYEAALSSQAQKQAAVDKTAAEKAAADKAAAAAKTQRPRRVITKPHVPRQNTPATGLRTRGSQLRLMRACLDAREALF